MRYSNNEFKNDKLYNGYDYDNQAWVEKGRYVHCGHPEIMNCDCFGRLHQNQEVA